MTKTLSSELRNRRRATGYLKFRSDVLDYNNNKYMMFVIRHITTRGKWYKVHEYSFSCSKDTMEDLQLVEPNSMLHVTFEIRTKEMSTDFYKTSLKALEIFQYDGDEAPEWYWEIKDGMTKKEGQEIKKKLVQPPDIKETLKNMPSDRSYHIRDYEKNEFTPRKPDPIDDSEDEIAPF